MNGFLRRILALQHRKRRRIIIAVDIVCVVFAALSTHEITRSYGSVSGLQLAISAFVLVSVSAITFNALRIHRSIIRHLDVNSVSKLLLGILLTALFWSAISPLHLGAPRSLAEFMITGTMMLALPLVGYRLLLFWLLDVNQSPKKNRIPVAVFGTDGNSRQVVSALAKSDTYRPAFIISNDVTVAGGILDNLRIYQPGQLDWAIGRFKPEMFIFSCSDAEFRNHHELVYKLLDQNITVRLNSSLEDQMSVRSKVLHSRAIELQDLIGRARQPVNTELLDASIRDKRILVTGAGGSIGSELCKRIADIGPASLAILDNDESRLIGLSRALQAKGQDHRKLLGSVCDRGFIGNVLVRNSFDTVFHAAAYKHVDFGEDIPISMIRNNVQGTRILLDECSRNNVGKFVFISSDKAVEPGNVMGATKKWCEEMIRSEALKNHRTRFSIVRFGNVIESSGSVVPLLKQQIEKGGPVTITDRRMKRYFMSIEEAVDLILQATALTKNGETFILKMGDPVPIVEIAEKLIRLSGNSLKTADNPNGDIEIVEIGVRPGEKLDEKLHADNEQVEQSLHPSILRSMAGALDPGVAAEFGARLDRVVAEGDPAVARVAIIDLLKEMEMARQNAGQIVEPADIVPLSAKP